MKTAQKSAVLISLINELKSKGSWCGETHIQKATYLLEEISGVPLNFGFILYKHGPYSFDLSDHLSVMKGIGLLSLRPQPFPYRPSIATDESAEILENMYKKTIGRYRGSVSKVASFVRNRGVGELERLATAMYFRKKLGNEVSDETCAIEIVKFKPHIDIDAALSALKEMDGNRKSLEGK